MNFFVDVHTHLTHEKFSLDWEQVTQRAETMGLGAIIVNGLDPASNREVLDMAARFPVIKPALGIYPVDAVWHLLPEDFPWKVPPFSLEDEIAFIREAALKQEIIAIGECGLDGHWLSEETFAAQEHIFEQLLVIAQEAEIPVIIHTRKREHRIVDILKNHRQKKVNFHCFGGKTSLASQVSEQWGWSFSIPANAHRNMAFSKMLKILPKDCILTETDAPFLSPEPGVRSEPANVIKTVELFASLRGWELEMAKEIIWNNYKRLFNKTL